MRQRARDGRQRRANRRAKEGVSALAEVKAVRDEQRRVGRGPRRQQGRSDIYVDEPRIVCCEGPDGGVESPRHRPRGPPRGSGHHAHEEHRRAPTEPCAEAVPETPKSVEHDRGRDVEREVVGACVHHYRARRVPHHQLLREARDLADAALRASIEKAMRIVLAG